MSLADKHNAAAMREALFALIPVAEHGLSARTHSLNCTIGGTNIDAARALVEQAKEAITNARAALAAPPRNCERFQTWPEAYENYWNEQGDPADWRKLGAWLFATAKEGRGDESPRTGKEAR